MSRQIPTAAFALSLALLTGACGTLNVQVEGTSPTPLAQVTSTTASAPTAEPTSAGSNQGESSDATRIEFTELGITLEVPNDLQVFKEPSVDLNDSSKLAAYLFYIQNYGGSQGPGPDYFQMYGHLQYDLPPTTWEQFAQVADNTTEYAYINPIEINGVRGFEGQFSGTRNRFIYMFYLDGRVLTIAVADPTPENKALADSIIQTLELLPGGLSDASGVAPVADPGGNFTVHHPDARITPGRPERRQRRGAGRRPGRELHGSASRRLELQLQSDGRDPAGRPGSLITRRRDEGRRGGRSAFEYLLSERRLHGSGHSTDQPALHSCLSGQHLRDRQRDLAGRASGFSRRY
ncbi:MAG: hypothetical protein P8X64_17395 [Anaerolineales bacterium]